MNENEAMRTVALAAIKQLTAERRAAHIEPCVVGLPDILANVRERLLEALRSLNADGSLTFHTNVNKVPFFKETEPWQE